MSFSETLGGLLLSGFVTNVVPWGSIAKLGVGKGQEAARWGHLAPHLDDFSDNLSLFNTGGSVVAVTVLFDEGTELNVA